MIEQSIALTVKLFTETGWSHTPNDDEFDGFGSLTKSLNDAEKLMRKANKEQHAIALECLSRAASMRLVSASINKPFKPIFVDYENDRRSADIGDFSAQEIAFFEAILPEVEDKWLKSRLADILWLCRRPKDIHFAREALEAYSEHEITPDNWRGNVEQCFERSIRICFQIGDLERVELFKMLVIEVFRDEIGTGKFMKLWAAKFLDRLKIDSDYRDEIAGELDLIADQFVKTQDYHAARNYFQHAIRKYKQLNNVERRIDCQVRHASTYEEEADARLDESNLVANSLYRQSLHFLREIPKKSREELGLEERISGLRSKIESSGVDSLDEMTSITSPTVDLSEAAHKAKEHVSGKSGSPEALIYFCGLGDAPSKTSTEESAKELIRSNPISAMAGSDHIAKDGRVVAKIPPLNLGAGEDDPGNMKVLNRQVQQLLELDRQFLVKGSLVPALDQLLLEHTIPIELIEDVCIQSTLIDDERVKIVAYGLWLGFEKEFPLAIYLLFPQLEAIARKQLKLHRARTTHIDKLDIESEIGLSALLELAEAKDIFGENLLFELKSVFSDPLGANLRNELAHGFLDDNTAYTVDTIYAWWMVFRIVIHSIMAGGVPKIEADTTSN